MRRRWLIDALAGLSLLLCLATAGLWVRSYWTWSFVACQNERAKIELEASWGQLAVSLWRISPAFPLDDGSRQFRFWHYTAPAGSFNRLSPTESLARSVWFDVWGGDNVTDLFSRVDAVYLPLWFVWLFTLPPALFGWRRLRSGLRAHTRSRLSRQGRCPACGYDLRATPGRCPECGIVPACHSAETEQPAP